jgi:hypothetical protein
MKEPDETLREAIGPLLRLLREAIAEARKAGASQEHIKLVVEVARQLARQRPYGVDTDWLVAQIEAAASSRKMVH